MFSAGEIKALDGFQRWIYNNFSSHEGDFWSEFQQINARQVEGRAAHVDTDVYVTVRMAVYVGAATGNPAAALSLACADSSMSQRPGLSVFGRNDGGNLSDRTVSGSDKEADASLEAPDAGVTSDRKVGVIPDAGRVSFDAEVSRDEEESCRFVRIAGIPVTIDVLVNPSDYLVDGIPATETNFHELADIAFDRSGNLYILDSHTEPRVWVVDSGGLIHPAVGTGVRGHDGDGGLASEAQLSFPRRIAFSADDTLFITDAGWESGDAGRIRAISPDGSISTFAQFDSAYLSPEALTVDAEGNVFVSLAWTVAKILPDGSMNTVVNSSEIPGYSGDGGLAVDAQIDIPWDLTFDQSGRLYLSDSGNQRVRMVDTNGIITTIVGSDLEGGFSGDGGPALEARLDGPNGLSVSDDGALFIADLVNDRVRMVDMDGIIQTIAGGGEVEVTTEGVPPLEAFISGAGSLAFDAEGRLTVSTGDDKVYQLRCTTD